MSRKMKIFIAAGLAVLLLVVGVAIPVMAEDTPTPTPPAAITAGEGVLDRAAAILGVSKDTLTNAIKQAKEELKGQKPTADDFFAKVASILNKDKATVISAFQEAAKETRDANLDSKLAKLVQKGTITSDEAGQIKDWFSQRPSAVDKLFNFRAIGGFWGRCHGFFGKFGRGGAKSPSPTPSATPGTSTTF